MGPLVLSVLPHLPFFLVVISVVASTDSLDPSSDALCKNKESSCRLACPLVPTKQRYFDILHNALDAKAERQQIKNHPDVISICDDKNKAIKKPYFEKEPQKWTKVADRLVYVFSAFYERRKNADGPGIRIIASGWQEQFNNIGDLYCHLWYEDKPYPVAVGPALYHRIYPSLAHPDMWVSHFIICKLPKLSTGKLAVPYAVSIVPEPCQNPTNALMVLNRKPVQKKGQHALCISPLYNHFKNWTMIGEMFELHKLLGAEEITIYQYSIHWHTDKLLESYVKDKNEKVNVVSWRTYPLIKSNVHCQRGALNDCLYRMGHKYKYVTITDLDEVLVPRMVETWPELMKKIVKPQHGAFLFQHAYFRRNYTLQTLDDLSLISQTSYWRTDVVTPPGKIRCKSMYLAEKAVSIDLHFPYLLVEGATEYILDPEEGMLHHYRSYPMESFIKHPQNYHYIEDRHMEKYGERLTEKLKPRFKDARKRF